MEVRPHTEMHPEFGEAMEEAGPIHLTWKAIAYSKKEFVMPNTTKTAVEIEWVWELDKPVKEDSYHYLTN